MVGLRLLWPRNTKTSADEPVSDPVYRAEVYRFCDIALQSLAKS
jgi:hypothetical protein